MCVDSATATGDDGEAPGDPGSVSHGNTQRTISQSHHCGPAAGGQTAAFRCVCVCVYFPQSHIILLFLPYRSEYASFNCLSACKISIHTECFISVLPYLNLNTQSEAVSNGQMLVDSHIKKCFEESHCKTLKYTGFICVCI